MLKRQWIKRTILEIGKAGFVLMATFQDPSFGEILMKEGTPQDVWDANNPAIL
jgi:hypothetical protein